jgi:hypothetical protein
MILKVVLSLSVLMTAIGALAADPIVEQGAIFTVEVVGPNAVRIRNISNKSAYICLDVCQANVSRFSKVVFENDEIASSREARVSIMSAIADDKSLGMLAYRNNVTDQEMAVLAKYTGNKIRERYQSLLTNKNP